MSVMPKFNATLKGTEAASQDLFSCSEMNSDLKSVEALMKNWKKQPNIILRFESNLFSTRPKQTQNMMQGPMHIWQYFQPRPSLYLTVYLLFPQLLLNYSLSLRGG